MASKTKLVIAGVVLLLVILAGSGYMMSQQGNQSAEAARQAKIQAWKDTLTVGVTEPFLNPDPAVGYTTAGARVSYETMCRLLVFDDNDPTQFHPEVADSWKTITLPDGRLALQLAIHPGLKFQDGTPVDATAVKSGIERVAIVEPKHKFIQDNWQSLDVVDANTLNFIVKTKINALNILGSFAQGYGGGTFASPTSAKTKTGGDIVGCGPYKFNSTAYVPGQSVTVDRWDDYPFKDRFPNFKHIVFRFFTDSSTLRLALESAQVDIASRQLSTNDLKALSKNKAVQVDFGAGVGSSRFMILNQRFKPLNDVRVRQAIVYALDINGIMNLTQAGTASRAYSTVKPFYQYAYPSFKDRYTYDPTKAKQLLTDAGYPNGFKMAFYWSDHQDTKEVESNTVTLIKEQLGKVGIDLDLKFTDWATITSYRRSGNAMPMGTVGWTEDYPDIDTFLYPLIDSAGVWGFASGINNTQVDQLITQGRALYDPAKPNDPQRAQIYRQIQDIMADQALVVPLWFSSLGVAWQNYVKDFHVVKSSYVDDFTGAGGQPPVPSKQASPGVPLSIELPAMVSIESKIDHLQ